MREEKKCDIGTYFHCKECMSGQLAVGITERGTIQVWCEKCDKKVTETKPFPDVHKLHLEAQTGVKDSLLGIIVKNSTGYEYSAGKRIWHVDIDAVEADLSKFPKQ